MNATFRVWLGVDGKYHRKRSSYSDFTDFSVCSSQSKMVKVGGFPSTTNDEAKEDLCPKCFKEKADDKEAE